MTSIKDNSEEICPVCLIDIKDCDKFITPCNHLFCIFCIEQIYKLNGIEISCSYCRHKFTYNIKNIPIYHNFDYIQNLNEREMLKSAYNTIHKEEKWEYLRNYFVDNNKGFVSSNDNIINNLMNKIDIDYNNHSGFTMGFTMRAMYFIAKNGVFQYQISRNV